MAFPAPPPAQGIGVVPAPYRPMVGHDGAPGTPTPRCRENCYRGGAPALGPPAPADAAAHGPPLAAPRRLGYRSPQHGRSSAP